MAAPAPSAPASAIDLSWVARFFSPQALAIGVLDLASGTRNYLPFVQQGVVPGSLSLFPAAAAPAPAPAAPAIPAAYGTIFPGGSAAGAAPGLRPPTIPGAYGQTY